MLKKGSPVSTEVKVDHGEPMVAHSFRLKLDAPIGLEDSARLFELLSSAPGAQSYVRLTIGGLLLADGSSISLVVPREHLELVG